jgi:hypothetical protein
VVERLGVFDLDPCGGVGQVPLAKQSIVLPKDGLTEKWEGRVWCNPPYGPHVGQWADKMAEHGNGIMLIFSRVETRAWARIWRTADGILFPTGRIKFNRPAVGTSGEPASTGTAPSALVAYGEKNVEALRQSGINGTLVTQFEAIE